MKKEAAKLWCKALRSGLYTQGELALLTLEGDFCCLGVACHMVGQVPRKVKGMDCYIFGRESDSTLPVSVRRAIGLYSSLGHRRDGKRIEIDGNSYEHLGAVNDSKVSFDEIADYIEANWEAL